MVLTRIHQAGHISRGQDHIQPYRLLSIEE